MSLWQRFRPTFREMAANGRSAAHANESVNNERGEKKDSHHVMEVQYSHRCAETAGTPDQSQRVLFSRRRFDVNRRSEPHRLFPGTCPKT